jgi:hypothetical protein
MRVKEVRYPDLLRGWVTFGCEIDLPGSIDPLIMIERALDMPYSVHICAEGDALTFRRTEWAWLSSRLDPILYVYRGRIRILRRLAEGRWLLEVRLSCTGCFMAAVLSVLAAWLMFRASALALPYALLAFPLATSLTFFVMYFLFIPRLSRLVGNEVRLELGGSR